MTHKHIDFPHDLYPTSNLTQNLLKLCEGLRNSGLNKYAQELENNFLNCKIANSHYQTSKEQGEDLIDAAHPKGSHKLEGVEGDAVIETIIDQHLKILEKVNKKPTGKLASNKDILQAVKIVLAQEVSDAKKLISLAYNDCKTAYDLANQVGELPSSSISAASNQLKSIYATATKPLNEITSNDVSDVISSINVIFGIFKPRSSDVPFISAGIDDKEVWERVKSHLQNAVANCEKAKLAVKESALSEGQPTAQTGQAVIEYPEIDQLKNSITDAVKKLNAFKMFINSSPKFARNPAAKQTAIKWIDEQAGDLAKQHALLAKMDPEQGKGLLPQITETVNQLVAETNDFQAKWIK